ncbi:uncharacterized protein ACRADG_012215 isoform 1-T5 [Cochliomyia hominivorax]
MIKTTKTNDYHQHINQNSINMSEVSTMLIDDKTLQGLKNECEQITGEEINLFQCIDDLVEREDEDDDNCTSTDQADYNDEEEEEERDLTNLTWLTELRNQAIGFVNMALDDETKKDNDHITVAIEQISIQPTPTPNRKLSENDMSTKSNSSISVQQNQRANLLQITQQKEDETRKTKISNEPKRPSPAERYDMFLNKIKRDLEIYEESAVNYQSDIIEKPPFNYSHIIGMAMLENGRRVTLQQICSWIERKFAFFRVRKKWNNSIRHNLSLHPCFRKIGRNKEDKGKGGYWELGVDPKKCDRKRIRNRKSSAQASKTQKKHLQNHYMKTTRRRQQNLSTAKKFNLKHENDGLKHFSTEQEFEELMLDEMDVQQNIDVTSTNSNNKNNNISTGTSYNKHEIMEVVTQNAKVDEGEVMIANYINNNEFNKICQLESIDICEINDQCSDQSCQQLQQQQQYKLGTIIISSARMGNDMPNILNINPRSLNSILSTNTGTKPLLPEQQCQNNMHYTEVDDEPQIDNVIISSYISNLSDGFPTCNNESNSNPSHNINSTNVPNSVTLDFSAFPAQTIQQPKQNVIVEHLAQPSLDFSAIEISSDCMTTSSTLNSTSTTTMCPIGSQNGDYTEGLVNENFRPYIDGIDEAFQYLRSIDNTRNEDILDNLLDISVSDY